ncbi:dipeptide ABC transporter ATP-binding protein [Devosia ginsengisoli]|nr:ABC transporter ATP-binding protein [Devosia ginsengisoli]
MTPLLRVTDLRVTLDTRSGPVEAVRGVSFAIARGQTLGLVGESGSGKSLTAMSLVGLAPPGTILQLQGTAQFDGIDLLALDERGMRALRGKRIGVVFQDPAAALDPLMTVGDHLREALPHGLPRAEAEARVAKLLDEVGLGAIPHVQRRYAHELSGGQQQRVVIASALAGDPDLLIADEPTTALDMSVQAQILQLLHDLQQARGMAMLLITHDLGVVSKYSTQVVVLRRGEMVEQGPTATLLARPAQDYTRMLLDSRPRLEALAPAADTRRDDILTVSGLSVSYPGPRAFSPRIVALDNIDFALRRGDALAVVGESGSGKSTLGKALVGLVPPDRGQIQFEENPLRPASMPREMRRKIQYIFQDSYGALNPRLNVEQALVEPFAIYGKPRRTWRDEAVRLLEEVDLSSAYLGRYPWELSGGQRQRVNIARALAVSPDLLICDEIVSALDVSVQAQVLELLARLRQTRRLSLIFISHDLAVVGALCNRTMVMRNAQLVEEGPTGDILTAPVHPYTRTLVEAARAVEFAGKPTRKKATRVVVA